MATSTPAFATLAKPLPALLGIGGPTPTRRAAGPWVRAWRRLRRNRSSVVAGTLLALFAVIAFLAPRVVTIDPYRQSLADSLLPPGSAGHVLGTDHLGRDMLLRLVDGARVSLTIGFVAVGISVVLGGMVGLLAGYFGGWLDTVLMRFVDAQLAFPGILAALVIVTVLGSGLDKAMIAVGIGALPRYARVVRGTVLSTKQELFVDAARSIGASHRRIMFVHIVPQILGPVITLATLGLATAVLAAAALSFLGLGAQPPTAEWGLMLSDARKYVRVAWWLAVFPGAAITVTVLAMNLLGDGVRDALDPNSSAAGD